MDKLGAMLSARVGAAIEIPWSTMHILLAAVQSISSPQPHITCGSGCRQAVAGGRGLQLIMRAAHFRSSRNHRKQRKPALTLTQREKGAWEMYQGPTCDWCRRAGAGEPAAGHTGKRGGASAGRAAHARAVVPVEQPGA